MENWYVFKSIKIEKVIFIITSPRASFLYGREKYTVKNQNNLPFFRGKKRADYLNKGQHMWKIKSAKNDKNIDITAFLDTCAQL
ncbi:hypothetical protein V063_01887 [Staphylococcus aureus R0487]|nr:hypothetical protein V063_01887 [Staphylococcus aureus R0487]EZY79224.1 hypothetical protein V066_01909 [Staphylococcus aureus R0615]